jgi:hypothetical protein
MKNDLKMLAGTLLILTFMYTVGYGIMELVRAVSDLAR